MLVIVKFVREVRPAPFEFRFVSETHIADEHLTAGFEQPGIPAHKLYLLRIRQVVERIGGDDEVKPVFRYFRRQRLRKIRLEQARVRQPPARGRQHFLGKIDAPDFAAVLREL